MKKFLTNYMNGLAKRNEHEIGRIERSFLAACRIVREQLGERPFHLRRRLNVAALDSVMACAMEMNGQLAKDLQQAYGRLRSDRRYLETVTSSTSDALVVRDRLELAHRMLRD